MKTSRRDWHELTGSYALDAVDGLEREAFERHLARCGSCATEVRGLRETAARLALAATTRPPAQMEERVLAATYQTRQLPPLASSPPRPARHRTPLPRLSVAIAAVSVAAAVALAIIQVSASRQLSTARADSATIAAVLAAPDARIATMRTADGGKVTVIVSRAEHEAIITTAGLPTLASTRVYQAWVVNSAGARSAGLLQAAPGGSTDPILAAGIRPGDQIGITIEPAGGTVRPTTTPLVIMPLPA